jgi:predicted RNA binding protein YcfA (HicA-like mRNA interferase family)
MKIELRRREIVARLRQDGWKSVGGKEHEKFKHSSKPGRVLVPRHNDISIGVARDIAKKAGWI